MSEPVTVLGAGIVGICCALELQRRGYRVRLLDRRGPGEETSSGNAGILSYSNITPLANPALIPRLHRLLSNRENDFRLHYAHLPSLLPWMLRFLARCRRHTYLRDGEAMHRLTSASIELHKQWIAEAGAQDLYNSAGGLKLYRSQETYRHDQLERDLLQQCGVNYSLLDARQAGELEPDLKRVFAQAVLIEDSISIRNPERLCKRYAQLFGDAGGVVVRAAVQSLVNTPSGWEVTTDQSVEMTPRVVVCLGAWTPGIIGPLGYANPLAIERGYHTQFAPVAGARLSRPIFDVDAGYVMAPMEAGLRVSSGSNLVHRETRPDPRQLRRVVARAREAFPLGEELMHEPWMGRRPTLPDTLPIIGAAPRHENLWLAFGHSHMGLTMGPISGQLIANCISGAAQPFSLAPCSPARYL